MASPKSEDVTASVVALIGEIRNLMELNGENPFKVRAFEKAETILGEHSDLLARAKKGTLTELAGIGKGIAEVVTEFLVHGKTTARDELRKALPEGLLELTQVPGLGPKKARILIDELGIKTLGELEYACRENRLLKIKGFGDKVQHKIREGVAFLKANQGKQRIDEALLVADAIGEALRKVAGSLRVSETGALRRRLETLETFDYLIELPAKGGDVLEKKARAAIDQLAAARKGMLPVKLEFAEGTRFGYELARTTGTPEHWKAMGSPPSMPATTEEAFFKKVDIAFIPPESRETGEEVKLAREGRMADLLPENGVQGVFHNHTTRSDGVATLEQMVREAQRLGYKYIGISDHSQTAFYAQGLKTDTLKEQEKEIRAVQEKFPGIRIFWGIESDILGDGSLDYDEKTLKRFDFVVASIHSRFQMDRDTMTARILEAVRNPYTRFLGHATGRLLLGRHGYDVDMEKIIAEAAKCDVAIEINANPARLDIDWRWGPELRKRGTLVSVNPDAHDVDGLSDTRFGVTVARKALLPRAQVVNARSVKEVETWLKRE
jgi:DNA polymerase (family 10)